MIQCTKEYIIEIVTSVIEFDDTSIFESDCLTALDC